MLGSIYKSFWFPMLEYFLHSPQLTEVFHHGDEVTLGKYQEDEEDHQYVFF